MSRSGTIQPDSRQVSCPYFAPQLITGDAPRLCDEAGLGQVLLLLVVMSPFTPSGKNPPEVAFFGVR